MSLERATGRATGTLMAVSKIFACTTECSPRTKLTHCLNRRRRYSSVEVSARHVPTVNTPFLMVPRHVLLVPLVNTPPRMVPRHVLLVLLVNTPPLLVPRHVLLVPPVNTPPRMVPRHVLLVPLVNTPLLLVSHFVPPVLLADTHLLVLHLVHTVPPELTRRYLTQHLATVVFLAIHLQRGQHLAADVQLESMLSRHCPSPRITLKLHRMVCSCTIASILCLAQVLGTSRVVRSSTTRRCRMVPLFLTTS